MRAIERRRLILHIDLAPFFVAVERARDASLRERPLVIGGLGDGGRVAAASEDARACGVEIGQPVGLARRLCPEALFRPGDFETYARVSDETTALLTTASPRVERPSADEAFVDLTTTAAALRKAVATTERLREAMRRQLGLDAAFGLAGSRLAARMASHWARPRGLLLLLPQHEASLVRRQPLTLVESLPPRAACALSRAGITTVGEALDTTAERLQSLLGLADAEALRKALDPEHEPPIEPAAPPAFIQEEQGLREPTPDSTALLQTVDALALRAVRRLSRYRAGALGISVGVRRGERLLERHERLPLSTHDAAALQMAARYAIAPILEPAIDVRALRVRLAPIQRESPQYALFAGPTARARA